MPRASKKNANQHNNRHENGVVAPGKRITKQKSNGHLNGSPEGRSGESTPPVPSAQGTSNQAASHGLANGIERRKSLTVETDSDPRIEALPSYSDKVGEQGNHRRLDVGSAKLPVTNDGGILPLTMTVLASCPLRDTLAILIFLLSLPPAIATITNAIFALLTFVPPSGSFALMFSMMPTISDITSSFSPGTPSLIVTLLIDIIAMSFWVWLPKDLQALALDAAQAMVATTLGGGYNYKPGATDNTLLCVSIVAFMHVARFRPLIMQALHRTYLGRWAPIVGRFDESYVDERYPVGERDWWNTIKVLIALHIVCQGFTRLVRRLLHPSRATPQQITPASKSTDPEASVGYQTGSELPDTLQNPPQSPMELRSRASIQNMRDVRDKISSGKRRRKQANYVRSQQPFWAAFAATKATIMREYETSRSNTEASSSNATGIQNFGNAPFETSENRVWVTGVQDTSFFFETSSLVSTRDAKQEGRDDIEEDSGVDLSKPLFVSCNGMNWSAVKLEQIPESQDEYKRAHWVGEVSMLSPGRTYQINFIRTDDGSILHSETVATLPAKIPEQPTTTPTASNFKHARPSSPTSPTATLKTSIAVFEANLRNQAESRSKDKRESRAATNALRREIDLLIERENKHASMDKNLKNRQLQQTQQMRQAEDAIISIAKEMASFTEIPEEETAQWKERRSELEAARAEMTSAQQAHKLLKECNQKAYAERQQEELGARHKRERLQTRLERLNKQYKKLTSPDDESHEKSRSNSDPSIRGPNRAKVEESYREQIEHLQKAIKATNNQIQLYQSQLSALEFAAQQAQAEAAAQEQMAMVDSRPITPEGDLPGTNPQVPSSVGMNRYNSFGTPESGYTSLVNGKSGYGHGFGRSHSTRERSISGLSGDAFYRDFDDDDVIPYKTKRRSGIENIRDGSDGSGSGGGSPSLRYRGKSCPSPGII